MRFGLLTISIALVAAAGLIGCQSSHPHGRVAGKSFPMLDAASASAAGFPLKEVNDAVQLGNTKCIRCHGFYDPTAYNDAEWQTWMTKMSKKAHLASDQRELLSRYLAAIRTTAKGTSTNTNSNPFILTP